MDYEQISELPKEKLLELVDIFSKNWLAMDGLWFQSVERAHGMDEAMRSDIEVWKKFTVLEANRIKTFLDLPEQAGLEGLARALRFRFYGSLNEDSILISGNTLTYSMIDCRVQTARERKGMEFHPCKAVGIPEYSGFAAAIDSRITTECVSCYPDLTDPSCACIWKFTLNE